MNMIAGLPRALPLSLAFLAAAALAAEPLARVQPESVEFDAERLHRIGELMQSYVDDRRQPHSRGSTCRRLPTSCLSLPTLSRAARLPAIFS